MIWPVAPAGAFALTNSLEQLEAESRDRMGEGPLPSFLPITSIETLPALFQVRDVSSEHVDDIARALREGGHVPPVLVLAVGRRVVLLDGHHRLEAHRKIGRAEVAVVGFKGTVAEAVLAACAANSVTKLPMTKAERQDAAWRYVLLGKHSKAEIAKASGSSERTVATMRAIAKRLDEEAFHAPTWAEAMRRDREAGRVDQTEEEREEWLEATAQSYADLMAKTFGKRLTRNPEIAARALGLHLGRRTGDVVMHLRDWAPDRGYEDY